MRIVVSYGSDVWDDRVASVQRVKKIQWVTKGPREPGTECDSELLTVTVIVRLHMQPPRHPYYGSTLIGLYAVRRPINAKMGHTPH